MDKLAPVISLDAYRQKTGRIRPVLSLVPEVSYEAISSKTRTEKLGDLARIAIVKGSNNLADYLSRYGLANLLEGSEQLFDFDEDLNLQDKNLPYVPTSVD